MSTQRALLGLMEASPRHGYELKRAYDERFGELRPLRFSQIYATLSRLERDGLVKLVGAEAGLGPERKTYAITPDGVADLEHWFTETEPAQTPIEGLLFLKIALALLSGRPARRILEKQRTAHTSRMRELTKAKTGADEAERILYDYALFHLEADLRWMDHTTERLDALRRELRG
jgi:DNA-binding PadR family transcriptional regulator